MNGGRTVTDILRNGDGHSATVPRLARVGAQEPTNKPTKVRSVPRFARNGAPSAPSQIVAEYAKAAAEAGNRRFLDARSKAILAGQAKLLMHQDDWPLDAVVRAVRRFAGTQRNPAFLREWCRINAMDEREVEHARFKAEERAAAPRTMRSLGDAMRAAGL